MYELIILSILIHRPAHGYLIAKVVNNVVGPFARVNNGRLYPLLAKMQTDGLVVPVTQPPAEMENGRQINCYQITEAGKEHFHHLMLDTTSNPSDYQRIFWLKAGLLEYLTHAERLHLIDHYINYCQSHIMHLTAKNPDVPAGGYAADSPMQRPAIQEVVRHRTDHWQQELQWGQSLRARELAETGI
jgi:DNA-binding PadR family transcriptional regulator